MPTDCLEIREISSLPILVASLLQSAALQTTKVQFHTLSDMMLIKLVILDKKPVSFQATYAWKCVCNKYRSWKLFFVCHKPKIVGNGAPYGLKVFG